MNTWLNGADLLGKLKKKRRFLSASPANSATDGESGAAGSHRLRAPHTGVPGFDGAYLATSALASAITPPPMATTPPTLDAPAASDASDRSSAPPSSDAGAASPPTQTASLLSNAPSSTASSQDTTGTGGTQSIGTLRAASAPTDPAATTATTDSQVFPTTTVSGDVAMGVNKTLDPSNPLPSEITTVSPVDASPSPSLVSDQGTIVSQDELDSRSASASPLAPRSLAAAAPAAAPVLNKIALENQKQGTPESVWDLTDGPDQSIQGFATDISTNVGGRVDFKIATDSKHYRIEIYRLGYYGGDGARLVGSIEKNLANAQVQPHPIVDYSLGLIDCGNWSVSASWQVPSDATSGVYLAKLVREDGTAGDNYIPFVVRDDSSTSNIVFQTSDTTWEAYNAWGGASLYFGQVPTNPDDMIAYMPPNCGCGLQAIGRAYAVSYNRPFITSQSPAGGPWDFVFGAEAPAIRWLEKNGYDMSYISGVDTARAGTKLLNHDAFLSVGHDEYWSAEQRANVEAARDAGVNLAFWSGNECYWKVRWENSIDGSGTPYRTMVCYKETWANADIDPSPIGTGTWRDPRFADPGQKPENALTGQSFQVDSYRSDAITVPYDMSQFRFWRNTSVSNLQPGESAQLVKNLLGYEWDSDVENGFRPGGMINLSLSNISVDTYLFDYGSTVGPNDATHSLTMYRAASGALVFGAGTVYWSWGLDDQHQAETTAIDRNVQQAMVNMFADMGIQPTTLEASLVLATQSTDHTAPVSTITSPVVGASFVEGQRVTVTGTAQDSGGGRIAAIEVSTDNGAHWFKATGRENWSYSWFVQASGNYTIKSRATDDSLNSENPGAGKQVSVALPATSSLWSLAAKPTQETAVDRDPVELGVRFQSSIAGDVVGIRFYKGYYNIGSHTVDLWTSSGQLLATAVSASEPISGWQTVTFSSPVHINANTTYVASYHSNGFYSTSDSYFANGYSNGPLSVQANGGVYGYGPNKTFPTTSFEGDNYWVDVVVNTGTNRTPTAVADSGFTVGQGATLVLTSATLTANDTDPDGDALSVIGASNATHGTVTYDSQSKSVRFTPTSGYTGAAAFTYTISDGRGGTSSAQVNLTVQPANTNVTLFPDTSGPAGAAQNDGQSLELGVKFVSQTAGSISAVRFYKTSGDTGSHTASLWTSTGTLLASATFAGGAGTGWQTISFASPVSISAGQTYVASYHSSGPYVADLNFFNATYTNGPLSAPSSATAGGNGVYTYGSASSLFPTNSYQATNYWVDVVYNQTVGNHVPVAVNDNATATQSTALTIAAATLLANDTDSDGDTLSVTGVSGATNGTVALNTQTNVITFTPTTGYTGAAGFTYAISDGHGGTASATVAVTVKAPNRQPVAVSDSGFTTNTGTAIGIAASSLLANDSDPDGDPLTVTGVSGATNGTVALNTQTNVVTFTPTAGYNGTAGFTYAIADGRGGTSSASVSLTVSAPVSTVGLFGSSDAPTSSPENDSGSVELGVKFVASASGTINGIRYYKSAQDTGTHTASLWTSTGTLLARGTFTNETASGWQTVTFSSPVTISAGTTYVASYHSNGHYQASANYFATARANGSLTAPASGSSGGNGVYAYGSSNLFPSASFNATNYWVDVLYHQSTQNMAPVASNDNGFATTQNTALTIAGSALLANDSDPDGDPLTITGVSAASNGTVAFNSQNNTITFTPTSGFTGNGGFTYSISDGKGGTANAQVSLSVTAPGTTQSLFADKTPQNASVNDPNSVELGLKFQADVAGQITAIKFYKGANNTGPHEAHLWTATGTLLATATFTNETASGWQTATLSQPVNISANTTYVASYHTNGNYAAASNAFSATVQKQDLLALSDASSGGNGVYAYGTGALFPTNSFNKSNYYVDVAFKPQLAAA